MTPLEQVTIAVAVAVAVAVPVVTSRRVATPAQRRDAWLSANAQRRTHIVIYALGLLSCVVGALVSTLIAIAGHPLAWALVALTLGLLVSTSISAVAAFRTPEELD